MKIFSAAQIKNWDQFTIEHEPVISVDLMERAASSCYNWIIKNIAGKKSFKVFCGQGNNGGDGLAIARMLAKNNYDVSTYLLILKETGSPDFEKNLDRLKNFTNKIFPINSSEDVPLIKENEIIIDALFGIGLNDAFKDAGAELVKKINDSNATIISIDVPSGLFADKSSKGNDIVKATNTLTFQVTKLAFMMPENESYFGKVAVLDIGLSNKFLSAEFTDKDFIDEQLIKTIYRPRDSFSHKGTFGYACLLAGSFGMMGAAVLSARACLKSGVGKLNCYIPAVGYEIMQISAPEALSKVNGKNFIKKLDDDLKSFNAFGIGPGLGIHSSHADLLKTLFGKIKIPIVIDADALNIIAENKKLLTLIPGNSILTPHPKEFEKLFGKAENDFERMNLALEKANEFKIFIILKGHHTLICTPDNKTYFNSTGNPGMATGGSGDVLTGLLTGLLAQKYSSLNTCILGVYLHGLAGDIAAGKISEEAMIAEDIIENLGEAFKIIKN